MAKRESVDRFDFTVEANGKAYNCYRVVSGTRAFKQRIHVIGVGSKPDGVSYGRGLHPVSTMEGIARLIAADIIREHRG